MTVRQIDADGEPLTLDYEADLRQYLQSSENQIAYLNESLNEGDPQLFVLALADVAKAVGFSKISADSGLNRESLYKMLSEKGNPQYSSIARLINSLGLRVYVGSADTDAAAKTPISKKKRRHERQVVDVAE